MAGKILTPVTLWENFRIISTDFKVLNTVTKNGVTFVDLYIYRPISRTERVAIYTKLAYNTPSFSDRPTLFLLQDIGQRIDDNDLSYIVSQGYSAVAMDIAGCDNASNDNNGEDATYTIYPNSISYANYQQAIKDLLGLHIVELEKLNKTVIDTPYYQWASNARYVINYVRTVENVNKLAVVAVKDAVTIGFHLASTANLNAFISLYGCGWQLDCGYKFSTKVHNEYNRYEHRILAGIEAQSYASYVTCPILMQVATNYPGSDFDRAYDTYSRVNEDIDSIINYSIGSGAYLSYSAFRDCELFLDKFLNDKNIDVPKEVDLEVDVKDGKIVLTVTADVLGLDYIEVYSSEGVVEPEYRCWKRIKDFRLSEMADNKYVFEYTPVCDNDIALFFAKAQYRNGFKISSPVVAKRYSNNEVVCQPQFNVIYASREYAKNGIFEALTTDVNVAFGMKTQLEVLKEIKGPMGILGLPATRGLATFNVLEPSDDAMLVLDVYSKQDCEVKIELICNAFTINEQRYFATVKAVGGNIWNKIQIEKSQFKTADGYHIKSYDTVKLILITGDGEFAINNLLWI